MFKNKLIKKLTLYTIVLVTVFGAQSVFGQTTAFTYQGKLNDGGNPANASYDMQFRLFDVAGAGQGTQQGATLTNPTVAVTNGNFTVSLDFGAAVFISGADRFLEISIRPAGSTGGYTSLAPRQKLTSAPYSVRSVNANSADTLSTACIGCVQNSNINSVAGSKVTGAVANATNATNAATSENVSGIVAIENGGTGSAKQNFIDLTSDQTITGNKAFNGIVSASALSGDGSGLNNLFSIYNFGGAVGSISTTGGIWVFPGSIATTTITVNGIQKITGSATAALGFSVNTNVDVEINLCYQNTTGGTTVQFSPVSNHATVTQFLSTFTVNNSVTPAAGTYRVGFCVRYFGSPMSNNSNIQGWVMVTNN